MSSQAIRTIGVIGTGVIGASWTALFLSKGLRVIATDPSVGAEKRLRDFLAFKGVPESRLSVDTSNSTASTLTFAQDIQQYLPEVDFVQENGPERVDYKSTMFAMLDKHCRKDVILASSSSGLPSSRYLTACPNGGARILIGHPFNPPDLIPLVEVVPNPHTDPQRVKEAMTFYSSLDKVPVLIKAEVPGFVANRLQAALVHEAYSLVSRDVISSGDLDKVVSNSIALRWALQGPFLTKVLGGGGGSGGFRHHLSHVGKAAQEWAEDMRLHRYTATAEENQKLVLQVDQQLGELGRDKVENLAAVRDQFLTHLHDLKKKFV